jgi:predicted outer membrane repeat protein
VHLYEGGFSSLVNCTFQNTSAFQDGGAIHADETQNIDVTACNFLGTVAGRNGGAVHLIGESTISASLRSCAFEATSSKVSGGAIYSESTRPLSVQGCTIIAAVAGDEGGGLWMGAGANLNLTASSFKDNSATFGGAVFGFQATSLHMDAVHFSDNVVRASGGAILCRACETVEVHGSSLLKNSAAIGAAIYADDLAGTSIISNTSFSNNTATGQGAFPRYTNSHAANTSEDPVRTHLHRRSHLGHGGMGVKRVLGV